MNTPSVSSGRADLRPVAAAPALSGFRLARLFLLLAVISLVGVGCGDDDPVKPTPGFEARGIVLRSGAVDTVVVDSTNLRGSLQMQENASTGAVDVLFLKKDGTRGVPGTGHSLTWTVADPTIVEIASNSAWQFTATGKRAGSTTVTFKLMNGTTTLYTSQAIPVTVSSVGLKVGDTLTYTFHDLDENNQAVSATEERRTWTVLRTGIPYKGKESVTEILEVATNPAGTIDLSVDTLYMQMAADGSLYQFDMLRSLLNRLGDVSALGEKLPEQWVRISNTSQTSVSSWPAMGVDSLDIQNVDYAGTMLHVAFRLDASHKGRMGATVPAGTYADAVHTDLTLRLNVRPAIFPVTVLFDSLHVRTDASRNEGILRQVFESKMLQVDFGGAMQSMPVVGYRMELKSYKRKP